MTTYFRRLRQAVAFRFEQVLLNFVLKHYRLKLAYLHNDVTVNEWRKKAAEDNLDMSDAAVLRRIAPGEYGGLTQLDWQSEADEKLQRIKVFIAGI